MDSPYTIEFSHSASVYMRIRASQRNGSQTNHYIPPGHYEVIASYQGQETMTVQFQSTTQLSGNLVTTPPPFSQWVRDAQQADPVTVIVPEGVEAYLRTYTTPRTTDLTDRTGVGSLLIIPLPGYGDE